MLAVAAAQVMTSRKKSTVEESSISPRAAKPTHAHPTFKSTGLNHVLMCVSNDKNMFRSTTFPHWCNFFAMKLMLSNQKRQL